MLPPSAVVPAGVALMSLASLLGPLTILAVTAVVATLVVTLVGMVREHHDVIAFERILEATARRAAPGFVAASRTAA